MRNILLIHEVRTIRVLLEQYISAELNDVQISMAKSIEEANECLTDSSYQLIISGNTIAQVKGTDVFNIVQKSKSNKITPFLLISSSLNDKTIANLKKAGVENYLSAPFSAKKLAETINELCDPRKWRTQDRFSIPKTTVEIHYQHDNIKGDLVNISKGGLLCDIDHIEECKDILQPNRISLHFSEEYGSQVIRNIPSAILRLEVIEAEEDGTPKRLRLVWVFKKISNDNRIKLDEILLKSKKEQSYTAVL